MNDAPGTKPTAFVTRRLPDAAWEALAEHVNVDLWDAETPPPYEVLLEKVRGKEALLCLLTDRIDERLIEAGPDLKVISQIAVGYDNIDVAAATARGIRVGNTPGVLTEATADFTFALLLAAARRIGEAIDYVHAGKWETWGLTTLLGHDVSGATLGIVGFGRIGRAVARRASGFDMEILYHSRERKLEAEAELNARYASLEELLRRSDFVSLHVNLTDQTRGLIGARELHLMKRSAILINTARGPVVNHDALYEALKERKIAYAALDVTYPEPLPAEHRLLTLPNIIVAPHVASATISSRMRMCMMAVENLVAGVRGEPLPFPVN
ncbi:MAG: D-glycerate dehydrogenase [Candidatus Promineifilaceae bacterium]|nr:D-glycerate dehydrogenase [Candidatus Promineifilaceae bacterium]